MEVERLIDENNSLKTRACSAEEAVHRLTGRVHSLEEQMVPKGQHVAPGEKEIGIVKRTLAQKTSEARELEEALESERVKAKHLRDRVNYLEDRAVHKLVSTNQTVAVGKRPTRTKAAVGINALSMSVGSGGGGSSHHSVAGGSRRGSTSSGAMESAAPGGGTPGHGGAASASLVAGTPRSSLLRQPSSIASPEGMARTAAAESAAATLRQENESLRSRLAASAPPPVPGSASFPATTTTSSMVSVPRAELHELERALKDKTSQVLLLKSRYEHLEAKAGAERELYDRALVVLEEQNGQIREARVALAAAEGDSASLASRAKAGEAATVELSKTREEVRRLERMLTELCQSPFLAQSKDALSKREHVESVERELAGAKEAVTHLQHTVRAQHAELGAMRRDKAELMGALEAAKEEASKAKVEAEGATKGMAVLRERLALFSGVLGSMGGGMEANGDEMVGNIFSPEGSLAVPPEELERALTLVRRRMDGGLGGTGASLEESAGAEVSALKRKIAALNLAVVSGAREAERTEALLAAQTSIARDLAGEVSELSARLAAEAGGGRKRLAETESLAERRGVRIGVLEAQVRQLIARCKELSASRSEAQGQARASAAVAAAASAGRGGGDRHQFYGEGMGGDDNDTVISALSGEGRVGDDSLLGGGGEWGGVGAQDATDDSALVGVEFGPGENVLEVYIVGARLEPGAFGRTDTTFALLEFFDFESKASPLATGPNPMYNFSSQYTIPLTPFFLTHAARGGGGGGGGVGGGGGGGCVSIDIYAAAHGDTVLRGRASLPLHRLLGPATKCVYPALTLLGLDGAVLGTLHVEARVALSLDSVWQSLVASRLGEGPLLAAAVSSSRALEDSEGCGARDNGATATATATTAAAVGGVAGEKRSSGGGGAVVGEDGGEGLTLPPPPSAKNTLTITLQAVQHLPNPLPRVYLSYSLPSLDASSAWDMASVLKGVTPTTSSLSTSPVFAYSRTFPCTTTPTLMAALAARGLVVSLFNADTGGEVASTHVSLAPLAQGVGVEGEFSLGGGGSTVSLKVALGGPLLLLDVGGGVGGSGLEASGGALYHVSREDALALCAGGEVEGGKGVLHRTLGAMLLLEEGDWGALLDFKRRVERVAGWRDIVAARGVASQASSSSSGEGGVISAPELVAAFQASDPVGSWDAIAMASIFRSLTVIAGSLGGSGNGGGGGGVSLPTPSILVLLSPLNGGALGAAIGARQHLATLPYPTRSSLLTCLEDCAGEAVGGGASSLYPPPSTMPRGAFIKGLQRLGVKISSPGEGGRAPTPPTPPATLAQQERAVAVAAAETLAVQETLSAAVAAALSATTALTGSGSSSGGGGGRGYEGEEEEGGASDVSGDALDEGVAQESLQPLAVTHQVAATTAAAAASMTLGSDTTTIPTFSSHSGVPVGFETVTSLVLTVHSLTRATPLIASPLKGVSPLLAFQFPASSSGQWKPVTGVLRASPIATGSDATFDAWAKAPGSGKTFGVTTTFSLAAGSPLALHLASALSQGANPEDADISFTLMMEGGAPLAKAVFSLRDMLDTRSDATNMALPLQALPALSLGSETVADLVISLKGAKAVSAALGQ